MTTKLETRIRSFTFRIPGGTSHWSELDENVDTIVLHDQKFLVNLLIDSVPVTVEVDATSATTATLYACRFPTLMQNLLCV